MKSFNLIARALMLWLVAFAVPVHAAGQADKDEWLRGKLFGPEVILKNQNQLKLSDKQRDLIGAELKRVQAQAADSDWAIMTEASQLQQLIDAYPVDGKAVLKSVDRVFEAENRKKRLYVEMLINIKNVLTAEQVAHLKSIAE